MTEYETETKVFPTMDRVIILARDAIESGHTVFKIKWNNQELKFHANSAGRVIGRGILETGVGAYYNAISGRNTEIVLNNYRSVPLRKHEDITNPRRKMG